MNQFHWVKDSNYITSIKPDWNTLSLLRDVRISFTTHNHFVFWTWNVSYQIPCPTIVFKSLHNCSMLELGGNETSVNPRKSIMRRTGYHQPHRDLLLNCESGQVRTLTLWPNLLLVNCVSGPSVLPRRISRLEQAHTPCISLFEEHCEIQTLGLFTYIYKYS